MTWRVEIAPSARRDMRSLPPEMVQRIGRAIDHLAETGQGDMENLAGHEREWRLRGGQYRVRLTFDRQAHIILVLRVQHRREAYRD